MRIAIIAAMVLGVSACNPVQTPKDEFWGRVSALCGHTYSGELVSEPIPSDQAFAEGEVAMDVRECSERSIMIDLILDGHVHGTWELTKHVSQLELRHHHDDGLTGYGGYSTPNSSGSRMNFPADDVTKEIFGAEGYEAGFENVWAMEARAGSVFAYELTRPGRLFRLVFSTTNPISDIEADENTPH